MESTGVYWRPVFYLLEGEFECQLFNARHLRHVTIARARTGARATSEADRSTDAGLADDFVDRVHVGHVGHVVHDLRYRLDGTVSAAVRSRRSRRKSSCT